MVAGCGNRRAVWKKECGGGTGKRCEGWKDSAGIVEWCENRGEMGHGERCGNGGAVQRWKSVEGMEEQHEKRRVV